MSIQPNDAKLVAPCGLYCGVCPVFMASRIVAITPSI